MYIKRTAIENHVRQCVNAGESHNRVGYSYNYVVIIDTETGHIFNDYYFSYNEIRHYFSKNFYDLLYFDPESIEDKKRQMIASAITILTINGWEVIE